jgi:hypothetical protein
MNLPLRVVKEIALSVGEKLSEVIVSFGFLYLREGAIFVRFICRLCIWLDPTSSEVSDPQSATQ